MSQLVALALAGALGTLSRYGTGLFVARTLGEEFPYGTLAVNAAGSLLLGVGAHVLLHHPSVPPAWRLPLTTGFLGAFTTFSTFSVETVKLLDAGRTSAAFGNVAANLILGLCLAALGLWLGRAWVPVSS